MVCEIQACDGEIPRDEQDLDGDGVSDCEGDCDDTDPNTYPGAEEICDGLDNDCDGVVPEDEIDDDGDGWTECDGDCDDRDPSVSPVGCELCDDGIDNDCDTEVDEPECFTPLGAVQSGLLDDQGGGCYCSSTTSPSGSFG